VGVLLAEISSFLPVFLASPTMYAGMLLVFNDQKNFRQRAFAAFIGCAVTVAVLGIFGILAGGQATHARQPTTASGVIDLVLAALLVLAGTRRFLKKPEKEAKPKARKSEGPGKTHFLKFAGVGFLLTITNPTSLTAYLASIKLTLDSGLNATLQVVAVSIAGFYFTLPIFMPLMLAVFAPDTAAKFLAWADRMLKDYGRYIIIVIIYALAVYLAWKGIDTLRSVQ